MTPTKRGTTARGNHSGHPAAVVKPGQFRDREGRFTRNPRREKLLSSRRKLSGSRRRYSLSAAGLAAKRAAIRQHKPWEHSTGPTTAEGKRRSAANGIRNRAGWRVVSRCDNGEGTETLWANGRVTVRRWEREDREFQEFLADTRRELRDFEHFMGWK
jgi:hypothetical protein